MVLTVRVATPTFESLRSEDRNIFDFTPISITITLEDDNGALVNVIMERRQFLYRLKWEYSKMVGVKVEHLRFMFMGRAILHMDTANKLDMPYTGTWVRVNRIWQETPVETPQSPNITTMAKDLFSNLLENLKK